MTKRIASLTLAVVLSVSSGLTANAQYTGGSHSGYASATVSLATTGLDDWQEDGLPLYPNPATANLTFKTDRPGTLTFTDAQGRACLRIAVKNGENAIRLDNLPAGLYLARFAASGSGAVIFRRKILRLGH